MTHSQCSVTQQNFATGTSDVSGEVKKLKDAGCKLVVFFGQGADMKSVFDEAYAQQFTAVDADVQWFLSELIQGQYDTACPDKAKCDKVIRGGIALTPDYGLVVLGGVGEIATAT